MRQAFLARDSVYAYLRTMGDDRILVVLNGSDRAQEFAMPVGNRSWKACQLDDLVAKEVLKPAGRKAAIEVEAFGSRVVRVR